MALWRKTVKTECRTGAAKIVSRTNGKKVVSRTTTETDPAKCRISTLRPSVHWFPVGAKVGDECLCGKTTRTAEEAELDREMALFEDEMDKWSEEMSDWSREMSDWGRDLHRRLSKGLENR
jgi:hypothetical protein